MSSSSSLNWDELLSIDTISLDEERNTSAQVSDYLVSNGDDLFDIKIDHRSLLSLKDYLKYDFITKYSVDSIPQYKLSKSELVEIINTQEFNTVFPGIEFPTISKIDELFSLLNGLSSIPEISLQNGCFSFEEFQNITEEVFSDSADRLLNSMVYLGYFYQTSKDNQSIYLPTEQFLLFKLVPESHKFLEFVKQLCRHETIKETLGLLFFSSFDRMTKDIMKDKLRNDSNIIEMNLSSTEVDLISRNIHGWFLTIKNVCL